MIGRGEKRTTPMDRYLASGERFIVLGNTTYSRERYPEKATGKQSGKTSDGIPYYAWTTGSEKR